MIEVSCCDLACGVKFGLPDHVHAQAKAHLERWFWCPNGHRQHYTKDRVAELTEEVQRLNRRISTGDDQRAGLELAVNRARRSIAYWKGIVSRLKGRRRGGTPPVQQGKGSDGK